ncbi:MAG: hypothetical protein NWF00_09605 [Candidatus Bathyarchaeota archaeon]|nr:hypothetical protein [Candidatus Bathyarchaeota archaeon]
MLKSKKGISPILATLLLIVIAVAAISVTYAWIMTYMDNTTDKAGVMLYEANVAFNDSANTITVDIGNSGTADADILSIYVGNSSSTLVSQSITSTTISAGTVEVFELSDLGWSSGATVYFKAVPSTGSPLTFNEKAP